MKPLRILVIDDERVICNACRLVLSENGHAVELHNSGKAGLHALRQSVYDLLLLDVKLTDMDGMEILKTVQKEKPELKVIVMTGYSTMANAIQAMKMGAVDYLSKPFTDDELILAVEDTIQK